MALTLTAISTVPYCIGDRWQRTWHVDFDSSYPTGGESLLRTDLGFAATADPEFNVDCFPTLGYIVRYDHTNQKILAYRSAGFTPAGTNGTSAVTGTAAAQVFTGSALAAHTHDLFLNDADQTDAANNRVNAAANKLGANTGSDITVAGVADTSGHGGIVQITGGTPAGTNASSALTATAAAQTFTGTAVAAGALVQVSNTADLSGLISVRVVATGKFLQ